MFRIPRSTGLEHRVKDCEQLSHTSNHCDHLGFAGCDKVLVEAGDDGIEADRGESTHK